MNLLYGNIYYVMHGPPFAFDISGEATYIAKKVKPCITKPQNAPPIANNGSEKSAA